MHDSLLNFINATFTNNRGQFGGALLDYGEISNIQITQSTIANNFALQNGGGVELYLSGFTFNSTNFYNNSANGTGGALDLEDVFSNTQLLFINCTIQGNHASKGGAMSILFAYVNFKIQNSIISKNTASQQAGGIYVLTDSILTVTMSLINSTITNNLISTGCEQDIICSGYATINLGISNCGNGNNCTLPLASCSSGCSADVCNCAYSSISHCTPLAVCPVASSHHHSKSSSHHSKSSNHVTKPSISSSNVAIIAVSSTAGAAVIIGSVYFINRKRRSNAATSFSNLDSTRM